MKNKKIRELLKDIADGLILGLVVTGMFVGAVKINAAGADTELPEEYQQYCEEIGQEYNICPELLMAVIERESNGDENAVGKYGEVGLMQVYPKYHMDRAERLGANNLFDPEDNIRVGADYLAEMFAEYSANYNDFGHNQNTDRFFEQMDFLTPELLRILKPGRVAAIHVKDRVLFGNATGTGMPTIEPFHAQCIDHYMKHGFQYFGMITVVTDVVRENNQTCVH